MLIPVISTMYFFRPLNANNIFQELNNVNRVAFSVRFYEKENSVFLNAVIRGQQLEYFLNLLEMTHYRRVFGSTNIQSQANAYDIVFVQNSNNYSVVINDRGYIVVDTRGTTKKYQILSSEKNTLLKFVDEMLKYQ